MAGIRLEWAQFGDFDSFDVVRSTSSMASVADEDLPSPIAIGLPTMFYTDNTITEGVVYYYKVRAWRKNIAQVSGEIKIIAENSYYQFYRIYITKNSGNLDNYSEMQEVEFAENEGGADITTPQTQTDQSSYFASRTAAKLVDNNLTDGEAIWTSGSQTFPQWVSFDFGMQKKITELRIYPTKTPYHNRAPKHFIVQGSNDGVNWTDIKEFIDIAWQDSNLKSFLLE